MTINKSTVPLSKLDFIGRRRMFHFVVIHFLLFLLFLLIPFHLYPQWINDPSENTIISDGSARNLKIKDSRESYYISYFKLVDHVPLPFLCRLNYNGYLEWPGGEMLITDRDLPSYPGQYDLQVDPEGNALIVIQNEYPDQSGNYLTIYKISPSGEFLWNSHGIKFQPPADIVKNPYICLFPDNSFVVMAFGMAEDKDPDSWKIWIRKYSKTGEDEWDDFKTISNDNGAVNPVGCFKVSDHDYMVIYTRFTPDGLIFRDYGIYACKIDQNGDKVWDTDKKISESDLHVVPGINCYQGFNDAVFVAWESLGVKLQGIYPDGSLVWEYHPMSMTSADDTNEQSPWICGQDSDGSIYILWDKFQIDGMGNDSLMGQKISLKGDLLWDPAGNQIAEGKSIASLASCINNDTVYIAYKGSDFQLDANTTIKLNAVDRNGSFCWGGAITINNEERCKSTPLMPDIVKEQGVICFLSMNSNSCSYGQVKIQNFWSDGTIGPRNTSSFDMIPIQHHPRIAIDQTRCLIDIYDCSSLRNIMLYDVTGRTIRQWVTGGSIETNYQLSIPSLAPGIYYLRLVGDRFNNTSALYLNNSN